MAYTKKDYIPVRRGAIYCAPSCGANCTWAEYQQAKKNADALVKKLGAGWEPYVHENLGWHFAADKGVMQVVVHRDGVATCYLNTDPQFIARSKNPKMAVAAVIGALDAHIVSIKKQRKALG